MVGKMHVDIVKVVRHHFRRHASGVLEQFLSDNFLKGQCHEIFCFCFFYESVSPQPQSIPLGPFRFFSKIRGDIRKSRCTTGVNDTGGKLATGINDTGGEFCHQFPTFYGRYAIARGVPK